MSAITISQVLGARFRVAREIDEITFRLHSDLNLGSKGRFVRLALGRSLGLNAFSENAEAESDLKGQEVPARAIFKDDDVEIWLGLFAAHARKFGPEPINSVDSLRRAIRAHWQRGALALQEDWEEAEENYERFVHSLVARRAHLRAPRQTTRAGVTLSKPTSAPVDATELVGRALREVGLDVEVRGEPIHGPRVTRYRIYLKDVNQLSVINRKLREVALLLNLQSGAPSVSKGDEARVVFLSIPRQKETWKPVPKDAFQTWLGAASSRDGDRLPVFLGFDELGRPFELALAEAPHLFVAGTTGSGKSVCLHAMIASLIGTNSPDQLQLALIDPKQVEFAVYDKYPGLYRGAVAYDSGEAFELLTELVVEMESRYTVFKQRNVSNWVEAKRAGFAPPRIVVFVEELADFLLSRKDADRPLTLLAQKARAAGIHLVLATQRPDAKLFAGLLRSNIPSRIALTVQKATESSIILDETGAEELLGAGDMLVKANGQSVIRVHGVFLDRDFLVSVVRGKR